MELSVIVITLNEEMHLPLLLDSLKDQTYKNFEVIVADADSTDRTRDIAEFYGCKVVKGGGYSEGRNRGAIASNSTYLFFVDADCELPPNFLKENLIEFKKSRAGTATTEVKPITDKKIDKVFFKLYDWWSRAMSKFSPHCCGGSIFCKSKVFLDVGGFDESVVFAENHEFTKRCKKHGFVILPVPMYTSVRRLDKDGRFMFFCKYIYAGIYRLFYKEIDKEIFKYDNERTI